MYTQIAIEKEAPRYEGQGPTPTEAEATDYLKELTSFLEFQTNFVNRVDRILTETGAGVIGLSTSPNPGSGSTGLPPGVAMPTGPPVLFHLNQINHISMQTLLVTTGKCD